MQSSYNFEPYVYAVKCLILSFLCVFEIFTYLYSYIYFISPMLNTMLKVYLHDLPCSSWINIWKESHGWLRGHHEQFGTHQRPVIPIGRSNLPVVWLVVLRNPNIDNWNLDKLNITKHDVNTSDSKGVSPLPGRTFWNKWRNSPKLIRPSRSRSSLSKSWAITYFLKK